MRFLLGLLLLLIGINSNLAEAAQLTKARLSVDGAVETLELSLTQQAGFDAFQLADPYRLVIDFESSRVSPGALDGWLQSALVRGVRSGRKGADGLRLVLDLTRPVKASAGYRTATTFALTMRPHSSSDLPAVEKTSAPAPRQTARREVVIAIDPGHGGHDPGAIGPAGTREKDVVLAVSLELARLIDQHPGMRALLTRNRDVFIPLGQRRERARAQNADLFISIHADAVKDRRVRGASVYTLSSSGAAKQMVRVLSQRERGATVSGVSLSGRRADVAGVLVDLVRASTTDASQQLASSLIEHLGGVVRVRKETPNPAEFAVLKSLDMPSVLVELSFISNPIEERQLRNPSHQRKLARELFSGVLEYVSANTHDFQARPEASHTVVAGDTLSGIGSRYGVSVKAIMQANGLTRDVIRVGQTLRIPR